VIETGRPYFLPEVDATTIPSHARSAEHGALLQAFATISGMTVPLADAGVTCGAMTFLYGPGGRRYVDEDLGMALELGRRIGAWLERIRVIDELQRANQAKDEFLGLVSHELRTPLTVLTGGIRVLSRTAPSGIDDERRELLRQMDGEGERMLAMVENLLTLARIEVGDRPASEPLVLERVVAAAVRDERARNPRMAPVREAYAPDLPLVFADGASVRLIVRNLLENASKFADQRGPIDVSLTAAQDAPGVVLHVCDRGPGVEPEELGRIFERFYRSPQTARQTRGSGLGLPLCKRLADAMGGSISAGLREGGGLEVAVMLPAHEAAGHPPQA